MKGGRVVIFGAAGFIGRNLVGHLKDKFQVVESDVNSNNSTVGDKFIEADVTRYDQVLLAIRDSDYVINLAAHALGPSLVDPITNAQINIIGTLNILEAAKVEKVKKVLFASASSVVGEATTTQVSEEVLTNPKTPYGVAKLACEHYFKVYGELWNINYVVFRLFNVYGPYQRDGLIPHLYKEITENRPVKITGDGKQIRDFVYVKDVVKFFEQALIRDSCSKLIVNLGTGRGTMIIEVARMMFDMLGKPLRVEYIPKPKGEISNFIADTTRLREKFGFLPSTPLDIGIAETITWLKENMQKYYTAK